MTRIYADTSDYKTILELNQDEWVSGFTTNPSLMAKAGVKNYREFAQSLLKEVTQKPISFEVLSDDFDEMLTQAEEIASWGKNVYVKIPIMNTRQEMSMSLFRELCRRNIHINVTALMTLAQIRWVGELLPITNPPVILSVFAGRIADTGRDAKKIMAEASGMWGHKHLLLWASSRQVYNYYEADESSTDIITMTPDLYQKLRKMWKIDLYSLSHQTVCQFYEDGQKAGLHL